MFEGSSHQYVNNGFWSNHSKIVSFMFVVPSVAKKKLHAFFWQVNVGLYVEKYQH